MAKLEAYNIGQNTQRLFHFLAEFLFTTSETEVDYYHQKVNVRVASRVAEELFDVFLTCLRYYESV